MGFSLFGSQNPAGCGQPLDRCIKDISLHVACQTAGAERAADQARRRCLRGEEAEAGRCAISLSEAVVCAEETRPWRAGARSLPLHQHWSDSSERTQMLGEVFPPRPSQKSRSRSQALGATGRAIATERRCAVLGGGRETVVSTARLDLSSRNFWRLTKWPPKFGEDCALSFLRQPAYSSRLALRSRAAPALRQPS
jgi:hypothetical protein